MAFTLKKIANSPIQKAREEDSERPYFNPQFVGSFGGQVSGTLKAKSGTERVEVEAESQQTIEMDVPGLAIKAKGYIVSQTPQTHKTTGEEYTLTTVAFDRTVYKEIRDDLVARAQLQEAKDIWKLLNAVTAEQPTEAIEE